MIEGTNLFLNLFFQALSTTQRSQQNQKQTQALHVRQYSITRELAKRGRASPVENREETEARESSGTVPELLSAPATSISPKGGGGTTSILLSLLLHDVH